MRRDGQGKSSKRSKSSKQSGGSSVTTHLVNCDRDDREMYACPSCPGSMIMALHMRRRSSASDCTHTTRRAALDFEPLNMGIPAASPASQAPHGPGQAPHGLPNRSEKPRIFIYIFLLARSKLNISTGCHKKSPKKVSNFDTLTAPKYR